MLSKVTVLLQVRNQEQRLDISPLTRGRSEGLNAFRFFFKLALIKNNLREILLRFPIHSAAWQLDAVVKLLCIYGLRGS